MQTIEFEPIGTVERDEEDARLTSKALRARTARIVVDEHMTDAMLGLETGDDVMVLFHFHRSTGRPLQVPPQGDPSRPLRGVFATRSPARPNPIGVTTVRIQRIEGNVIEVIGLDAVDGTPVLDIKTHAVAFDTPYENESAPPP